MLGVIAVCVAFGLLALLLSLSRWLAHRPWAAAGNLAVGLGLLVFAQWLWPPVLHLQSYEPMRTKAPVAQVHSERTGPSSYRVTLTRLPAGRMQVLEMAGDEWRLDARTLVWIGRAAKLGLPDSYRLDRLSGRYLQANRVHTAGKLPPERRGRTGRRHLGPGPDGVAMAGPYRRPPRLWPLEGAGGRRPLRRRAGAAAGPAGGRARGAPCQRSGCQGDALH